MQYKTKIYLLYIVLFSAWLLTIPVPFSKGFTSLALLLVLGVFVRNIIAFHHSKPLYFLYSKAVSSGDDDRYEFRYVASIIFAVIWSGFFVWAQFL